MHAVALSLSCVAERSRSDGGSDKLMHHAQIMLSNPRTIQILTHGVRICTATLQGLVHFPTWCRLHMHIHPRTLQEPPSPPFRPSSSVPSGARSLLEAASTQASEIARACRRTRTHHITETGYTEILCAGRYHMIYACARVFMMSQLL